MYDFIKRIRELYPLLQDERSKDTFLARLAYDTEPSDVNLKRLTGSCAYSFDIYELILPQMRQVQKIINEKKIDTKKVVVYGTKDRGKYMAKFFEAEHMDFFGFCGRGAHKFPDGLMGKPVISPDVLFQHTGHSSSYARGGGQFPSRLLRCSWCV